MKTNPTRYSSQVGEVWIMLTMKTRYCHNVFDKQAIREYTDAMLTEAMDFYGIRWRKKGFDSEPCPYQPGYGTLEQAGDRQTAQRIQLAKNLQGVSMASKPTLSKPRILEPCNRWTNRRHELLRQLHSRPEIRDKKPIKTRPVPLKASAPSPAG